MTPVELKLGTRGSALALTQSQWVADQLGERSGGAVKVSLEVIRTRGDAIQDKPLPEIGGKGLFTQELEDALRAGTIHLAVHSLKDLPTEGPADLTLGAYPAREDPRDALIGGPLVSLAQGARVGTGSSRRAAQLLAARPDLRVEGIRGNVDTRLRKQREGVVDAVMLAMAGLRRLGFDVNPEPLDPTICTPAPGQGILGVQCRADAVDVLGWLKLLDDADARVEAEAERAFLAALGGGCSVPAGALARRAGDVVRLQVMLADGAGVVRRWSGEAAVGDAAALGREAAAAIKG